MALEDELREYRSRISTARNKRARAQAEYDAAQTRQDLAKQTLKEEHGVSTPAEAKKKLLALKKNLDAVTADIETKLEEAGA